MNHYGSTASMEASGLIQCIKRSVATNKERYTTYIGWRYERVPTSGKSSPVSRIPYPVCVGHAQKRVGKRLGNLKKNNDENPLNDSKSLVGKRRLDDKVIYYILTNFQYN